MNFRHVVVPELSVFILKRRAILTRIEPQNALNRLLFRLEAELLIACLRIRGEDALVVSQEILYVTQVV